MLFSYADYEQSAGYLRSRLPFLPTTAVVLGSGLNGMAADLTDVTVVPYEDIPFFHKTGVQSHAGRLMVGKLGGKPLLILSGRSHFYEGYSMEQAAFPVRVLYLLGIKTLILTNAAGGVNEQIPVGGLMLISDHIKLCEESPVRGAHLPQFGERFFDMGDAYSVRLRTLAKEAAVAGEIDLYEGVYFFMAGPQFETPAEIRAIRTLGGDAVGMSTVFETITAVQCGMEVLGISCITNPAAGLGAQALSGEDVVDVGRNAAQRLSRLIEGVLEKLEEK